MKTIRAFALLTVSCAALGSAAVAQDAPVLNWYGVPGMLDMPSALMPTEADFSVGIIGFGDISRTNFSFQITPRLGGTFRYGRWGEWNGGMTEEYFERSLDLRYQLIREDTEGWKPSVVVGLQDLGGTGLNSAEYIVATKSFGDRLTVSAGLGWGRFGTEGSIGSFGTRPTGGRVGTVNANTWFKGDFAPFAGATFKVNDKIRIMAEYSSDAYLAEDDGEGIIDIASPFNIGMEYRFGKRLRLGAAYMYGSEFGLSATVILNPNDPPIIGSIGAAPTPVRLRDARAAESWGLPGGGSAATQDDYRAALAKAMSREGLGLESLSISGSRAVVRVRNGRYDAETQAIGRAARAMTTVLPPQIETFVIEPIANTQPAAAVTIKRTDLEQLENAPDGTEQILSRLDVSAPSRGWNMGDVVDGIYPRFSWGIAPYVDFGIANLDNPTTADIGIRLSGRAEISPGLVASATISQVVLGNIADNPVASTSPLPHVRSDAALYAKDTPILENATLAYYFLPGENLYAKVGVGYFERMFGGVAGEILWKPVDQNYGIGAEIAYVQQRDYDGFGFLDYEVVTGHVSGYYAFDNGYNVAVHAGRYLAGDWGATVDISREFNNGWTVSAYATMTDVSYDDFGTGAFSKGLKVEIPISWALGKPTRKVNPLTLMSMSNDGGAMLKWENGLYDEVNDYHSDSLESSGGMFWR